MINHELWDAIDEYLCENDPDGDPTRPRLAVPKIERIVRMYRSDAWCEGVQAGGEAWAQQSGDPSGQIWRAINDIANPYEK